jgi:hypothetical protein
MVDKVESDMRDCYKRQIILVCSSSVPEVILERRKERGEQVRKESCS